MEKVKAFCREHRYMLVLLGLILAERLVFLLTVGPEYYIASDDGAYVHAGILFARTGRITIHETVSAQIMPGMPVFIGLVCKLVGEGTGGVSQHGQASPREVPPPHRGKTAG